MYQGSPLRYSQYDRGDMAVPSMYRGDLGYMWEQVVCVRPRQELRGQQGDVGYIPNRYFNRMNRGNPPDLMQVSLCGASERQMFDSQDRMAQMHEGYGYPPRVNPMMRMEQSRGPQVQPVPPVQQERQMNNPYWINGNMNRDYLWGRSGRVRRRMRQNAHVPGSRMCEEGE